MKSSVVGIVLAGSFAAVRGVYCWCCLSYRRPAHAATIPVLRWADEGITDLVTLDPASIGDENARLAMGFVFEGLVRQGPNLTVGAVAASRSSSL